MRGEFDQDFGGAEGRWSGWNINRGQEGMGSWGVWPRPVVFDVYSKGGESFGRFEAKECHDEMYISASSFWTLGGK